MHVRDFTERPSLFSRASRIAVAVPTRYAYALSRMGQLHFGDRAGEIGIFYSLEEAERWMGLEPSKPERSEPCGAT